MDPNRTGELNNSPQRDANQEDDEFFSNLVMEFDFDKEPEWQEWNSQQQNEMVPTSDIQPQSMQPPSAAESSGATATLDPNGTGGLFPASGGQESVFATASRAGESGGSQDVLFDELLDDNQLLGHDCHLHGANAGDLGNKDDSLFLGLEQYQPQSPSAAEFETLPHVPPVNQGPTDRKGARLMQFIPDGKCRLKTFQRRKMTLEKNGRDLSTFCGVDIAMVVFGPEKAGPEIWPSKADGVIDFYILARAQNKNKSYDMADFLLEKALQAEDQLRKEREKRRLARYPIPGGEDWYNSREEIGQFLAAKIEAVKAKMIKDSVEAMKGKKKIWATQPHFVANLPSSAISEPGTSARGETSSPASVHVHLTGNMNIHSIYVYFSSLGTISEFFLYRPSENGVFTRLNITYLSADALKLALVKQDGHIHGQSLNWHDVNSCSDGSTPTNPLDSDFLNSGRTAAGGAPETPASGIVHVEITAITDLNSILVYFSAFGAMLDLTLYKPGENCCFRSAVINYVSPHSSQRVISMGSGRLIDGTWQARVLIG
ncbi:MADS-box transcription factor family protein [Striga asiatica]|uniref:MADS-box transcription factor family protein n=1 Tax=Striga asiatica TaxID=4170 RepID=A0A5A7PFA3_STRAF|nr:MADS-box transcription factor family protein [Striga asiatica]